MYSLFPTAEQLSCQSRDQWWMVGCTDNAQSFGWIETFESSMIPGPFILSMYLIAFCFYVNIRVHVFGRYDISNNRSTCLIVNNYDNAT